MTIVSCRSKVRIGPARGLGKQGVNYLNNGINSSGDRLISCSAPDLVIIVEPFFTICKPSGSVYVISFSVKDSI
jgi:hypothetical protein